MKFSYGFIETRGYVAAIEAADAMAKAADVELVRWRKSGGALVVVIIRGELGACKAAVDAGSVAANRIGQLVSAHIIPNPFEDTETLVTRYLDGKKKKQQAASVVSASDPVSPVKVKRKKSSKSPFKSTTPVKKPSMPKEKLLFLLASKREGFTLKQIAEELHEAENMVRKMLKKMMDQQLVEKVQKRYFIIEPGVKK